MTIRTRGSLLGKIVSETTRYCNYPATPDRVRNRSGPIIFYESISSESPRFARYGNCRHEKIVGVDTGCAVYCDCTNGTDYYQPATGHYHVWPSANAPFKWSPPELSLEQAAAEAYLTMKPSLNSGFSLSNFILELAELKFLLKIWRDGAGYIAKWKSQSKKQRVAQGYLGWNFGVKLFVQDCITMHEKLTNMEQTLNDYKSRQGRPMTSHWKYQEPQQSQDAKINTSGTSMAKGSMDRVYHASMRYTYTVPAIDSEYAKLKGILDILGLQVNASVIWEAIPFSFVGDWWLGVGNYLQALRTDYLDSVVHLQDFCVSRKDRETRSDRFHYSGSAWCHPYNKTWTVYERKRMIPDVRDFGIRETHRYGSKQMLLSTALLLA